MRHRCTRAPVARTSSKMVCSAMVSAITGTPDRPRREASGPLAATPPRPMYGVLRAQPDGVAEGVRVLQRAQQHVRCRAIGTFRLREADAAGLGQLGHLGQRRRPSGRRSARRADTRAAWFRLRARNLSISTRPGSSSTGSVSGGQTRLVTPPCDRRLHFATPAWPCIRSPARAGARDRSTRPGATTRPARVDGALGREVRRRARRRATILPSAMYTSALVRRCPLAGSISACRS